MKKINIIALFLYFIIYISCSEDNNTNPEIDKNCMKINDTIKITLITGDTSYHTKWIRKDTIHIFDSLKYSREYNYLNVFIEVWMFKAVRVGEEKIVLETFTLHDTVPRFSPVYGGGKVCK